MIGSAVEEAHTLGRMSISTLSEDQYDSAVSLWEAAGLTRPWNDPMDDLVRAMNGETSTVLGWTMQGGLAATAMVGHERSPCRW